MTQPGGAPPPGEQLLSIDLRVQDGALVVRVVGEVDTLTAARLRDAMDGALRSALARRVVVDLRGVTLLASAGLRALAEAAQQAEQRHEPLRVVVDHHRPVLRPIQITDLQDVLTLCETLDDALAR